MKRRSFVKNMSLVSLAISAGALKSFGSNIMKEASFSLRDTYTLKGLDDETEEYPKLVSNGEGENWLFTLRRIPYPQNKEDIACYKQVNGNWEEAGTASLKSGQYENPAALCLPGEEPIVTWNMIQDKKWNVIVTRYRNGKPTKPVSFSAPEGKAINPKLFAGEDGKVWLTWENYFERRFSIYACKLQKGRWSEPKQITPEDSVCFDPAITEGKDGRLYMVYGTTDGFHQNIEMRIYDSSSLEEIKHVPVAIGGGLKNRVNLNTKPSCTFDKNNRLWISWENNRNTVRLNDSDVATCSRCCSMVAYIDGKIMQPEKTGRWLFDGINDHLLTFVKNNSGDLYAITRCGGDFKGNNYWRFRVSSLQPDGWTTPEIILTTKQKGQTSIPSVIFNNNNEFLLAWRYEKVVPTKAGNLIKDPKINVSVFSCPEIKQGVENISFTPAVVEEFHPKTIITRIGGRQRINRQKMVFKGEEYTLIVGNLHEHTEGSYCWPAGTDGDLHENYRYGLYSEGYDFVGLTDHTNHMDELYWRKNVRTAEFYNDGALFIALPSAEWTLTAARGYKTIPYGVGHRNVIFASARDAEKFVRNKRELYSHFSPECDSSPKLCKLLSDKNINCVAIPHHVTDEVHPCDWNVHNDEYEPVVELFQCRGNSEYRGCPRENNLSRHQTTKCDDAFMDYALREKGYKMGFIASGDHNGMGVGLASLWVKEVSRKGILEALRARRCYATTGDKIYMDVQVNDAFMGQVAKLEGAPKVQIKVQGEKEIERVELLRNSRVIEVWKPEDGNKSFNMKYTDEHYEKEIGKGNNVLYYYVRVRETDEQLAWSSPVFFDLA